MYTPTLLTTLSLLTLHTLALPNPFIVHQQNPHLAKRDAAPPGYAADPTTPVATHIQSTKHITSTVLVSPSPVVPEPTLSSAPTSQSASVPAVPSSPSASAPAPSVSAPAPSTSPAPGELAGVYICRDVNFSGPCKHYYTPLGTAPSSCTQLDGTASSIGPDDGFVCTFYTNAFCDSVASDGSDKVTLKYPGEANLVSGKAGNWNDKIHSYQCLKG